jgi:Zn finger protein HypA/HybF involved in hydrogenase expression
MNIDICPCCGSVGSGTRVHAVNTTVYDCRKCKQHWYIEGDRQIKLKKVKS